VNYRLYITDNNVAVSVYADEVTKHKSRHLKLTQRHKISEPWPEYWTIKSKARTPLFPKQWKCYCNSSLHLSSFTQTLAAQSISNALGQFANQSLPTAPRLVEYCLKLNTDPASSTPYSTTPPSSSINLVRLLTMYSARAWGYTGKTHFNSKLSTKSCYELSLTSAG
jgi:hypothetical protein